MTDMYSYRIIYSDSIFIPDTFVYLVNRKYFPLIFYQ